MWVVLLPNIHFYTLNLLEIIVHRLVFRLPEMDEQPAPIVIVVLGPPVLARELSPVCWQAFCEFPISRLGAS